MQTFLGHFPIRREIPSPCHAVSTPLLRAVLTQSAQKPRQPSFLIMLVSNRPKQGDIRALCGLLGGTAIISTPLLPRGKGSKTHQKHFTHTLHTFLFFYTEQKDKTGDLGSCINTPAAKGMERQKHHKSIHYSNTRREASFNIISYQLKQAVGTLKGKSWASSSDRRKIKPQPLPQRPALQHPLPEEHLATHTK